MNDNNKRMGAKDGRVWCGRHQRFQIASIQYGTRRPSLLAHQYTIDLLSLFLVSLTRKCKSHLQEEEGRDKTTRKKEICFFVFVTPKSVFHFFFSL